MRLVLAAASLLVVAGCGGGPAATDPPESGPDPSAPSPTVTTTAGGARGESSQAPPPFRVRYDETELAIHPYAYCYGNLCVDGFDPDPPDLGSPGEIHVYVPVEGFELEAHATEVTDEDAAESSRVTCGGRSFELQTEDLGDGWHAVRPTGPAGHYDVQLFAHGKGDMAAGFRWRTTAVGAMPKPSARLALISNNDGEPDSYGLELAIDNLARTPRRATASIEVTAGNGRSMTIEASQAKGRCRSEGDLYFDRPDQPAKVAAALGPFPFTTTVTLTLDGRTYRATALYPDDEIKGNEPSVALQFRPALPGLRPS